MQSLLKDLRYALRQLRNAPGFAVTVILTLALGIGATTAIFTLVYDVMLRPLPYEHPERLVVVQEQVAEFRDIYPQLPVSANHFVMWQRNARSFESLAVMGQRSAPMGTGDRPLQVELVAATPGLFQVLNTQPQIGRAFTSDEAQPGHERVIVLMNDLWRTQFQSDKAIAGKTITLNGFPYTVLGVMPPSFHLPFIQSIAGSDASHAKPVQALVPMAFSKDQLEEAMGDFNYFGLARLRPGVSVAQASAEINELQRTIQAGLSAQDRATLSALLTPYQQVLIGNNRTPLLILLAAVAGLLLVGCVNIMNLLLSRAVGRRQQMAVAAALGASRANLLHMAMRETTVLAAMGGGLGILLAAILVPAMQHYLPSALDFRGSLHLDWAGAACAFLLAVITALLAGAAPAWIGSRTQPSEVLHAESRLASESHNSKRLRRTLVAVEVAVSVALVLMTGLLTASLVRLMKIDRGFDSDRTMTAEINLPSKSYSDKQSREVFYRTVLERINQLPGVEHAGVVSQAPLTSDQWIDMVRATGDTRPPMQIPTEHFRWVSPGYLEAIHLPLIAGRLLTASDEGKNFALVSDLTARTIWPGRNPIGQQFTRSGNHEEPTTVIGVVKDARTISLAAKDPMMVYMPYWYRCESGGSLLVRTHQDPATMADAIRKAVWTVDAGASVPLVRSLGGVVADSVANRRFEMDLLLLFAVSALLLAGLGVYGVVTYSVVQRQREIGLRLALGAQRANIYVLVLREGLTPVLIGAAAGVGIAFGFARVLASLLFEVSPYNPVVVAATIGVLTTVGVAACLLPARRAAAVDPMRALRSE
ncbi:MAG TPA: ABC transporter permease [Terracidiphilus sp.]|nr:ABC transporter permease [Terracidiphilus sp.]